MSKPEQDSPWASMTNQEKGDYGELAFMTKMSALRLHVSKPHGQNQPFDFIVCERSGRPLRVQVRSTWCLDGLGGYRLQLRASGRSTPLGYDVLIGYVPPFDAWYIIPAADLPKGTNLHVWPHARRPSRSKWERYRSAWRHLSGDPQDDNRLLGLTIHAAADDGTKSELP